MDLSFSLPPASQDVRQWPYFSSPHRLLSRWAWRFWQMRLTPAGRGLLGAGVLIFLFLAGSISPDLWTFPLFFVWVALWGGALIATWTLWPRVHVSARHAERILAGETLRVTVQVTGRGRGVQRDLLLHPWGLPRPIHAETEEGVALPPLGSGEIVTAPVELRCTRRGVFTLAGWRVETDFPFGVMNSYRVHVLPSRVIVHPDFTPLSRVDLPVGRRQLPGGIAAQATVADSFEYLGNREFREGDNIRDIDWHATARLAGAPIVREWREEYFLRVGVILDTRIASLAEKNRAAFERAISLTAAISDWLANRDWVVELFAAGPSVHRLTAGRGLAWREQILDLLADVEPRAEGEPLENVREQLLPDLPGLTSVVCVLCGWDFARQTFVNDLRQQGIGVKAVIASGEAAADSPREPDTVFLAEDDFAAAVTIL